MERMPTTEEPMTAAVDASWTEIASFERLVGVSLPAETLPGVAANLKLLHHHWLVLRGDAPSS